MKSHSSRSYAFLSHFLTSASISFGVLIGMRCVIRFFFANPPVSISRPVGLVSPKAKPKSILDFVVGLISAKT